MASSCPMGNNNTMKENLDIENNWDKIIPISSHLKNVQYGSNKYLLLLSYINPYHLIGVGLLASLFLPTIVIGVLSFVFLIYPLIRQILRYYNYLPTPYSEYIIPTTYTARCDGDFVVFLLGVRAHGANPFTKSFVNVGKALQSMIKELESDPTLGYMGGDSYIGSNDRKSTTVHVQYWRDYESLQKWTHTKSSLFNYVAVRISIILMFEQYIVSVGILNETHGYPYQDNDGVHEDRSSRGCLWNMA